MDPQPEEKVGKKSKRAFSMRFVLASTFGALVALSVGTVLFMSARANLDNTFSLLNDRAEILINGMERAIQQETARTELAVRTISSLYANKTIPAIDNKSFDPVFRTVLATESAVEALFITDTDGNWINLRRRPNDAITAFTDDQFTRRMKLEISEHFSATSAEPEWGEPITIGPAQFHFVSAPLVRDRKTQGYVVAAVGRYVVNRIIAEIARNNDTTAFVLDKNNNVIAYSPNPGLLRDNPNPNVSNFPDEALTQYTIATKGEEFQKASEKGITVLESKGRDGYVFITKPLREYSDNPYTLGAYFAKSDIGKEVFKAIKTFFVGFVGLLVAVLVAFLLGRRISLPMIAIAKSARKLSAFEIDGLEPLPRSRIREINDQAEALNNVQRVMREFARYVPRPLVERLMRSGEDKIRTVEREITILFSDIVGFTSLSERMNAVDTAKTLNDFFDMQCQEIEASNGTVDKFMGDGLMAFWGAPDADPEHPSHAVATAVKITNALGAFNDHQRDIGAPPLRIRIGIHTGRVVVGNIGGGSRQNYTIVGDAVNLAQRLEQMGRDLLGAEDDAIVLISGETVKYTGDKFQMKPAGTRMLRGREKPVAVYILETGVTVSSEKIVAFPGSGRIS